MNKVYDPLSFIAQHFGGTDSMYRIKTEPNYKLWEWLEHCEQTISDKGYLQPAEILADGVINGYLYKANDTGMPWSAKIDRGVTSMMKQFKELIKN